MRYSVPYTIFGSIRAAIYVGDMYLVLNATAADAGADPPFRQSDPLARSSTPNESAAVRSERMVRIGAVGTAAVT